MTTGMRVCLAVAALIACGTLAGALVLAHGSPQATRGGSGAAVRPAAAAQHNARSRRPRTAATPGGAAKVTASAHYSFRTFDNPSDPTFNQLLGINNNGHIAGYFGSGAAGHPNRGYLLRPPYGQARYQSITVPGSAQTQVTGLDDEGVQVGFWSPSAGAAPVGFYLMAGRFHNVSFPAGRASELLGVNNRRIAVGYYTDASGNDHAFSYAIATGRFATVNVPGAVSVTAAAINDGGAIAGFFTTAARVTDGFFLARTGQLVMLSYPGATLTRALGVNDAGEVVGDYRAGSSQGTHGFTWDRRRGFQTVDDPDGTGGTAIHGLNNGGDLVGSYIDGAGDTHGLLAVPGR